MPTLDLPLNLVNKMLDQASDGEQLLAILNAVCSPDPVQDTVEDVTEPDEDEQEPSDDERRELVPEVVDVVLEVENFDPQLIDEELADWDHIPDNEFTTL